LICVAILVAVVAAGYAFFVEPRMFRVNTETIQMATLPVPEVTFLHVSDTHFRAGSEAKLAFFRRLAGYEVDFVVATGDLIDTPEGIACCKEAFSALRPRLGAFAVFGTHDHYDFKPGDVLHHLTHFRSSRRVSVRNATEELVAALAEAGVRVLGNENVRVNVNVNGSEVVFAGVDDPFISLHDLDSAMAGVEEDDFVILLIHAVDIADDIVRRKIDMVFGGHTHGGQVRLPFFGALVTRCALHRKFACGVFRFNGTTFHINRGIGAGRLTDFRFCCPPEATIVRLVRTSTAPERQDA